MMTVLYQPSTLAIGGETLEVVHTIELLDMHLYANLKWSAYINNVCWKASKRLFALIK